MFFVENVNSKKHETKKSDQRNRLMRPLIFPQREFPTFVDLRQWMTPIEEQGDMKTCCANAFVGICEYLIKRSTGRDMDVSRLFLYYNAQIISQQTLNVRDEGVDQRDVALGLMKYGLCEERFWPYQKSLLNVEPSAEVYENASRYTVVPLKIAIDVDAIRICLINQIPVPVDVRLRDHAGTYIRNHHGYIDLPLIDDTGVGRTDSHTILLVGFNDRNKHFIARNSYGESWGYEGYFYLPYEYISQPRLRHTHDGLWTIMKIIRRTDRSPTVRQLILQKS